MSKLTAKYYGNTKYCLGLQIQTTHYEKVMSGKHNELIMLEHPHIYTLGVRGNQSDILKSSTELKQMNIDIQSSDRGGEVTYHGPGQLVAYPIINIKNCKIGPKEYIYRLENSIINFLSDLQIYCDQGALPIGVWVKSKKIASIGVRIRKGITTHGIAININTDLSFFNHINACGLTNTIHTSVYQETKKYNELGDLATKLSEHIAFSLDLELQNN
jgi:lipoyl(octanoyl) transferase